MSGNLDAESQSVAAVADALFRAEGAVEGGVPLPRRRRHGAAGGAATHFEAGGVSGADDAVLEGGIIATGMDATNALITSATMAQASDALDALGRSREIARRDGRGMFWKDCVRDAEHDATTYCSAYGRGPNGETARNVEECVRHWVDGRPEVSTTTAIQSESSTGDGTTTGKGGKHGESFKVGGDGKVVKGELQSGGERNWSEGESHSSGTRHMTSGSTTVKTPVWESEHRRCREEANEHYRRLFPY